MDLSGHLIFAALVALLFVAPGCTDSGDPSGDPGTVAPDARPDAAGDLPMVDPGDPGGDGSGDPGGRDVSSSDSPVDVAGDADAPGCRTTLDCAAMLGTEAPSPCLRPWCDPGRGVCDWTPMADGASCDDGDPCTEDTRCGHGECVGRPLECGDGNACTVDRCEGAGTCAHEPVEGPCDDENACTPADACVQGTCVGGTNTCQCGDDADCAGKDDGNRCNGTLHCREGACVVAPGTVIVCPATASPCLAASCREEDGSCLASPANDGAPCNDGDLCTLGDRCSSGRCEGTPAAACDDGNPCTDDRCDAQGGCVFNPNAVACDDGNACTKDDTCRDGTCVGRFTVGCGCRADPDCAGHEDGNRCNGTLMCVEGQCRVDLATIVACDAVSVGPCKVAGCDPETGRCVAADLADGRPCDDGDACTPTSLCVQGDCQAASPTLACDDGSVCTLDLCDRLTGCVFQPLEGPCPDENACTFDERCSAGTCQSRFLGCDDGNPCTGDTCDPVLGCVHAPLAGTSCDDGSLCTTGDRCVDGRCAGDGIPCDDRNVCTEDTCDALAGCRSAPLTGGACDDGLVCTSEDRCEAGACGGTARDCDDGDPCTDDRCEEASGCVHGTNAAPCDDGNGCTADDACAEGSCAGSAVTCETPPPNRCVDADVVESWSRQGTCGAGGCEYQRQEIRCSQGCADGACIGDPCAGVDCTVPPGACFGPGVCSGGSCDYPHVDGTACDDGDACTASDACTSGLCAGQRVLCNAPEADGCLDGETALLHESPGTCNPATAACEYATYAVPCDIGCSEGRCVVVLGIRQSEFTGWGRVGLSEGVRQASGVLPGWTGAARSASERFHVEAGFGP